MKTYTLLVVVCYVLLTLIALPLAKTSTPPKPVETPSPVTPVTKPENPPPSTAVFKVLDTAGQAIYSFSERDFLIYTVAAEMPASYPAEALKAQAIASYTFYTYEKQKNAGNSALQGADFSSVPSSFPTTYSPEGLQKLWGEQYTANLERIALAVDAVFGKLIVYEDKPIFAAYHSCNWGNTESSSVVWGTDFPYLQSVPSSSDSLSPHAAQTITISDETFAKAFPNLSLTGNAAEWIVGTPTLSPAGSVTSIPIGNETFSGKAVREALDLPSACFSVSHTPNGFSFEVKGFGHGVGMSQFGAKAMAEQGFNCNDILKHYYTGVAIV